MAGTTPAFAWLRRCPPARSVGAWFVVASAPQPCAVKAMIGTPLPVPSSLQPLPPLAVLSVWLMLPAMDCATKVSTSKSFFGPGAAVRQAATSMGPAVLPPPNPNVTVALP